MEKNPINSSVSEFWSPGPPKNRFLMFQGTQYVSFLQEPHTSEILEKVPETLSSQEIIELLVWIERAGDRERQDKKQQGQTQGKCSRRTGNGRVWLTQINSTVLIHGIFIHPQEQ